MDDAVMFHDFAHEPEPLVTRWFSPGAPYLRARWLFLRALGLTFFSAFYSLWFQIHGLIGGRGILPAVEYLQLAKRVAGAKAYWLAPTLLWISARDSALTAIVVAGALASMAITFNLWPRLSITIALLCFLSFIAAAQDFASYQSDGMLLEAAFLSLFLAPRGLRPGLGASQPPSFAAVFVLRYEWFRIYFESGLVKLLSGEEQWRNFTAMDKYYENGPLPTFLGWHVQQWPHGFHAATAATTLIVELFLVWLMFVPSRRVRIGLFALTSLLQIGIILTANYAFLNYLVLALGILLVEDREKPPAVAKKASRIAAVLLPAHVLTTTVMFLFPNFPTARLLAPARIVNSFGLFAVMTRARYELEFQGTRDGTNWIAYPFRYKPQDLNERPRIYAPYQPRFDWNLWFATIGDVNEYPWVVNVEERLIENSPPVLQLFRSNPFAGRPPIAVRVVIWQYWFTTREEHARTGAWWNRKPIGEYAPQVTTPR